MRKLLVRCKGGIYGGAGVIYNWMLITGDTITAIDDDIPSTLDFDLIELPDNCTIIPGLIDSHLHVNMLGEQLWQRENACYNLDCSQMKSVGELQTALQKFCKLSSNQQCPLLTGTGWHESQLGGESLSRQLLDCVDRPVALFRNCYHLCILNSAALNLFGLPVDGLYLFPDYRHLCNERILSETSQLLRASGDVSPVDGSVCEAALFQLKRFAYLHLEESVRMAYFTRGLEQCMRRGLTAVQTNDFYGAWPAYKALWNTGGMKIRVYLTVPVDEMIASTSDTSDSDAHTVMNGDVPLADDSIGLLSCHRVKIFADGSLGAKTAALRQPYSNSETSGQLNHSQSELERRIRYAHDNGFRVEIHTIGDRAVEQVLDALQSVGCAADDRPILTHCQVMAGDLIRRMAVQGAIANVQPLFLTSDGPWVCGHLGSERMRESYCWKSLLEAGVMVAGGSDAPVEDVDPFLGMHAAIFRTVGSGQVLQPEQRLTFDEALQLYTVNGAYTAGDEDRIGRLAVGYRADFVVLDTPVWLSSHERQSETFSLLQQVRVQQVWVDGQKRYSVE